MSKKGRREEWHKLTTYARIGEYDKKTKKWVYHCEKVVLKVSDPHGPKVSHNVIDLSVSLVCQDFLTVCRSSFIALSVFDTL